ncbi:hypothetical protein G6F24_014807 [Rhizopus arrhizus]|nr:hypothetical protein G6F24_014807 [Rhizopus arrhizus]
MPNAACALASGNCLACGTPATEAKPIPEISAPRMIQRRGCTSSFITNACARIRPTPTAVSAMPAMRAPAAASRPNRSIAKKPTVTCAMIRGIGDDTHDTQDLPSRPSAHRLGFAGSARVRRRHPRGSADSGHLAQHLPAVRDLHRRDGLVGHL